MTMIMMIIIIISVGLEVCAIRLYVGFVSFVCSNLYSSNQDNSGIFFLNINKKGTYC
jgi:hypothetical protein